nr:unnamed protein product [Callosobruchus analis]
MISTIRPLEEESQRNNQQDIQQDRSTQKVLNGKEVREPVNTSQEIINKSSRAPRGKDSVETHQGIVGNEKADLLAKKATTSVLNSNIPVTFQEAKKYYIKSQTVDEVFPYSPLQSQMKSHQCNVLSCQQREDVVVDEILT